MGGLSAMAQQMNWRMRAEEVAEIVRGCATAHDSDDSFVSFFHVDQVVVVNTYEPPPFPPPPDETLGYRGVKPEVGMVLGVVGFYWDGVVFDGLTPETTLGLPLTQTMSLTLLSCPGKGVYSALHPPQR